MPSRVSVSRSGKRRRAMKRQILFAILLAILILGILALIIYGLHRPEVRIQKVDTTELTFIKNDQVLNIAKENMSGSYLWFVMPRDNFIFYPKNKIKSDLLNTFPSIQSIDISRVDIHSLLISIKEKTPQYLWCEDSLSDKSECFYTDHNGFVFSPVSLLDSKAYVYLFGREIESKENTGYLFADSQLFNKIIKVKDILNNTSPVVSIAHMDNQDISFKLKNGIDVYVDMSKDVDETINRLNVFFAGEHKPINQLEYIDARFGPKLFFK